MKIFIFLGRKRPVRRWWCDDELVSPGPSHLPPLFRMTHHSNGRPAATD